MLIWQKEMQKCTFFSFLSCSGKFRLTSKFRKVALLQKICSQKECVVKRRNASSLSDLPASFMPGRRVRVVQTPHSCLENEYCPTAEVEVGLQQALFESFQG